MTEPLLQLENVVVKVNRHTPEELQILNHLNLTINQGDSSIEENTKKIISAIKTIQH